MLFDAYLFVDWSARGTPSPARPVADALWVGEREARGDAARESYWRTRDECCAYLREWLLHHRERGHRVLAGFDFCFGYPEGFAAAAGLNGPRPPWLRLWRALAERIEDDSRNRNNRFQVAAELNARCGSAGPLWGCPPGTELAGLARRSPGFPFPARGRELARFRRVDLRARARVPGLQEAWKLAGTGSVGGQSLVGIPRLLRLREDPLLREICRVWPFETGFTDAPQPGAGPAVLLAEVWPGVVRDRLDPALGVRDRAQVRALGQWAAALDAEGELGRLFACPPGLSAGEVRSCVREEGWILGF